MSNEEITEGNKAISEFMGKKKSSGLSLALKFDTWYNGIPLGSLKYHSSLDWLLPVLEKIKVSLGGDGYWHDHFPDALESLKIEAVWLAVVNFIKWKNSQP